MEAWSAEQVLALAPDAGSAKSGRELAAQGKWVTLGAATDVLWGECQGSGKSPYQTKIDLTGPAFHCSCPSRKFPCKHGLGLFLLWANQPAAFASQDPPDWVTSWLDARAERAEKKAQKVQERQEKQDAPGSEAELAARRKRERARLSKIDRGLDDVALWLGDLMREGLVSLQSKSSTVWETQARRLIDAQAPGVARRVRQMGAMPVSGQGWEGALLDRLANLHLLVEAWRRQEGLAPKVQAEIRSVVGLTADQAAIQVGEGVRDVWQVIGQRIVVEDRLKTQRTWLLGQSTRRAALVLAFAHGSQPLDTTLPPGISIDAELAFFPAALPLRALVKVRHAPPSSLAGVPGHGSIASACDEYARALARSPWLELYPLVFDNVFICECEGAWMLRDAAGAVLPLVKGYEAGWHLLALSGGQPLGIAAQFDGEALEPMSCWLDGRFWALPGRDRDDSLPAFVADGAPADVASGWAELVASASVGLDRRPAPNLANGGEPAAAVASLEPAEPAARLLGQAAAASWYARVGRKPKIDPDPAVAPAPPDDLPICGTAPTARLARILGGEYAAELPHWLALLAEGHQRIPERFLPELLTAGARNRDLRPALRLVLGNRGRWLALQNSAWSFAAGRLDGAEPEVAWQTGTRAERTDALNDLRSIDPARARELLASTWAAEPAADRAGFLRTFETGLSMADEPWLESLLDERTKAVRKQAAELLARLPQSRLCQRMVERARRRASWNGKTWEISLPESCDGAMQRDAIEPKPQVTIGERAWWLQQIVALTPLETWCHDSGQAPARLVESLAGHEWQEMFWSAWASVAIRHAGRDWAFPLLLGSPKSVASHHPLRVALWDLIDPEQRDAFLVEKLHADGSHARSLHATFLWVSQCRGTLGHAAGREVLGRVRQVIETEIEEGAKPASDAAARPDFELRQLIECLGPLLPVSLTEEAERGMRREVLSELFLGSAYQQCLDHLRFRFEMRQEFFP